MSAPTTTLQAAGDEPLDLPDLLAAITPAYAVETGPRRSLRRASLDTFDGLLHAAGLRLEHHRAARGSDEHLLLTRADGSTLRTPAAALVWPAMPASLPGGPVRDAVAAACTIRALMVARVESRRVRCLAVRNDDGKIVVRLELDEPVTGGGRPATVSVRELRGYADQARRVERLLTGAGLTPAEEPSAPRVAAAATASDLPQVAAPGRDSPASQLLGSALIGFQREMDLTLPGTIDDVDSEFLHDFRVAVRRTRATLKLGRPALPDVVRADWEPAFKWLGDLTTPVRDLDVYELDLPTMAGWLLAADASDLDAFAEHLRRRRTTARKTLVRTLRSTRYRTHRAQWAQLLTELAAAPAADGDMSAGELADAGISTAYRRVAKDGGAITADSPAQDLHDLRKRCKELRYALEVFAPVLDVVARKAAVTDLKGLQDVLGRFQDTEVQRHALRDFAEEMVADGTAAGALLAMGELIGHLDAEQARARTEFAGAFATFVRPASTRRMQRLGGRT